MNDISPTKINNPTKRNPCVEEKCLMNMNEQYIETEPLKLICRYHLSYIPNNQ